MNYLCAKFGDLVSAVLVLDRQTESRTHRIIESQMIDILTHATTVGVSNYSTIDYSMMSYFIYFLS